MGKKITELFVEVRADLDRLDAGIKRAEKRVAAAGERMQKKATSGVTGTLTKGATSSFRRFALGLGASVLGVQGIEASLKIINQLIDESNRGTLTWQTAGEAVQTTFKDVVPVLGRIVTLAEEAIQKWQEARTGITLAGPGGREQMRQQAALSAAADSQNIIVRKRIELARQEDARQKIVLASRIKLIELDQKRLALIKEQGSLTGGQARLFKSELELILAQRADALRRFDARGAQVKPAQSFVNTLQTITGSFKFAQGGTGPVLTEARKQTGLQTSMDVSLKAISSAISNLTTGTQSAAFT